ncbi:MAG: hypothetical protein R3C60_03705 [Parvularculaceae bacterium]
MNDKQTKIIAAIILFLAGVGAYAIYQNSTQSPAEKAAHDLGKAVDAFKDEVDN